MPAGRLEGVLGQRRTARGDGPDPNADVPCEDNWRSGGQMILDALLSKAHRVVIPGLIAIEMYHCSPLSFPSLGLFLRRTIVFAVLDVKSLFRYVNNYD